MALPEEAPPPPKERMVAMGGQLRTVRDAPPPGPNGTGFTITLDASPALNETAVVVVRVHFARRRAWQWRNAGLRCAYALYACRLFQGRVLEGQELLASLTALPTNRNADEAGLFFAVAKSIGDKRATVAEKGFGRPLSKVQVAACGAV